MQKVPGVTSVTVSLNDGLTILDFAADNNVSLLKLRETIRNNGFVTNESRIVATGTMVNANTFEIAGSKERLMVSPPRHVAAGNVVITGTVNTKDPKAMTLTIVKSETP